MQTEYKTPETEAYQVDAFQLDESTVDYIFAELRKHTKENRLLFVWNKGRIVFMCPDPEIEEEFAKELCEWLNSRNS
ncbi:hypothetical protein GR211_22040 [Rhizobium leguminosarum]|uniref:hypothetical protein n=1 Tax=Rhizobium ruizarguesonis TaxID=2081791 RepID=UPI0013B67C6F|nr:hypothetical protein [Rhizobium ruizarguesonis]NEJ15501.1 hypothetical protein [Rhizobium ruizarguesonis]NEK29576.1 hypothetical protein [Rhizobium ruizarguesonis]